MSILNNAAAGSVFWQEVNRVREETIIAAAKQGGRQPRDGKTCFIVSVRQRAGMGDPKAQAGSVVLVPIQLGGQRIAEGSHDLASDDQISDYLAAQIEARKIIESDLAKARNQIVFQQPRPLEGA